MFNEASEVKRTRKRWHAIATDLNFPVAETRLLFYPECISSLRTWSPPRQKCHLCCEEPFFEATRCPRLTRTTNPSRRCSNWTGFHRQLLPALVTSRWCATIVYWLCQVALISATISNRLPWLPLDRDKLIFIFLLFFLHRSVIWSSRHFFSFKWYLPKECSLCPSVANSKRRLGWNRPVARRCPWRTRLCCPSTYPSYEAPRPRGQPTRPACLAYLKRTRWQRNDQSSQSKRFVGFL